MGIREVSRGKKRKEMYTGKKDEKSGKRKVKEIIRRITQGGG